jgi:hypothetical protein
MALDGMLSIAVDCWTSPYQQSFLAICGYFISASWQLQDVIIPFKLLYRKHFGDNIGEVRVEVLL